MKETNLIKILCSIPVILLALYYVPFLGVCLIILRNFAYYNRKHFNISYILVGLGFVLFVPKIVLSILKLLSINNSYLTDLTSNDIYLKLVNYGKSILIIGTIFIIISFIAKRLINKSIDSIKSYIIRQEQQDYEISKQNDMAIKLKQEQAKNTNVIYCPKCGASNLLTDKVGICKYCRSKIENKTSR